MHMMKTYENLCPRLERELVEVSEKKEWTREDIEDIHHILKSLCLADQLKEKELMYEEGASSGYPYYRTPHSFGMSYGSYGLYGRDGDGDGRYNESSRDNFRNSSYRGSYGSYDQGFSRDNANKKMVQKLETLKDDTLSERDRMAIDNCIADITSR